MSFIDIAEILQSLSAIAFWPVFLLVGKRYPGRWSKSLTVAGFLLMTALTFLMGYYSPAEPELILAGSPDGKSQAVAIFRRNNSQQTRVELQVRSIGADMATQSQRIESDDPHIYDHCELIWDADSAKVRLVDRFLVLDFNRSSSVLELERTQ
jgi:hypothetical protein